MLRSVPHRKLLRGYVEVFMSSNTLEWIVLTEINQCEGEEWSWWIPYRGNEQSYEKLKTVLEEAPLDNTELYDVGLVDATTDQVEFLCEWATHGYFNSHNMAKGINDSLLDDINWDYDDPLYKGGIIIHE